MENNIFSLKRFAGYFSLQLAVSWKTLLIISLCVFGGLIIYCSGLPYLADTYIVHPKYAAHLNKYHIDPFWDTQMPFFYITFFIFSVIMAANMFSNLNTKNKRITVFTLPASNLEKFTTNFIIYIIFPAILFFVSIIVGDYIRVFTTDLYTHSNVYVAPMPLEYFFSWGHYYDNFHPDFYDKYGLYNYTIALYYGFLILMQSFIALISCIWPKNSFIKGAGIAIVWTILIFTCFYFSVRLFGSDIDHSYRPSFKALSIGVWTACIIATSARYCLTYFRFKENEIINRW